MKLHLTVIALTVLVATIAHAAPYDRIVDGQIVETSYRLPDVGIATYGRFTDAHRAAGWCERITLAADAGMVATAWETVVIDGQSVYRPSAQITQAEHDAQQAAEAEAAIPIAASAALSSLAPILTDHPATNTIPSGGMYYRLTDTNGIITLWFVRTADAIATQLSAHDAQGNPIIRTRKLVTGEDSTINVAVALQATVRQLVVADSLSQEELAALVDVFPQWIVGKAYAIGDVVRYEGTLYKCVQAHTSQADWMPSAVPALWVSTAPPEVVPAWVQPTGAHDAYNTGDRVTFDGGIWESKINANVWSPTAYPAGWARTGDA